MYLQAPLLVLGLSAPLALSQSLQIQITDIGCVFVADSVAGCTGTSDSFATPNGNDCSDITHYNPAICGWTGYDNMDPVASILLSSSDYGDANLVTFGNGDVGLECDLPNLSNGASCSPTPTPVTSVPVATSTPSA